MRALLVPDNVVKRAHYRAFIEHLRALDILSPLTATNVVIYLEKHFPKFIYIPGTYISDVGCKTE